MPFTAAHPAIVLPLRYLPKRFVSLTALIIGSITPDFEYFIRMQVKGIYGHEPLGLLYFDLPLGLLIYVAYQLLVKNVLIDLLPGFLNSRFAQYKTNGRSGFMIAKFINISTCLIIGAASHLFWDAFTHPHGYFVSHIQALSNPIFISSFSIPGYKALQHGSTLLGVLIITYTIVRMPVGEITKRKVVFPFWIKVGVIATIVLGIRLLFARSGFSYQYGMIIVSGISSCLTSLLLASVYDVFSNRNGIKKEA